MAVVFVIQQGIECSLPDSCPGPAGETLMDALPVAVLLLDPLKPYSIVARRRRTSWRLPRPMRAEPGDRHGRGETDLSLPSTA